MGIIQTQAIKGTIYSYLGVGIGFIITALLFPRILSSEEIGVLKLLVSFSVIFAQFSSLGFINVINRLFPYFRDKTKAHNGLLTLAFIITTAGFLLSLGALWLLSPLLIKNNADNSALFLDFINYLIPLILFTSFFNLFDSYVKALFDAVIGTVLKELVQRLFILVAIVLYYFDLFDFKMFVLCYTVALSFPTLILLVILYKDGELRFNLPSKIMLKEYRKEIIELCFFGILIGFGGVAIIQIDSILVNRFLGLSSTGIYATNFFFATLILIPSRPLIKISTTILAEAWKRLDMAEIQMIYTKSSINQAVIGILIFIGLWVNIDNIYFIITPEYEPGKWVIFFVGLANVFDMITGINAVIIQTSAYFKVNALITFVFLLLIVILNLLLIPIFSITGAGIATFVAVLATNSYRFIYLKKKFGLNPFNSKIFIILAAGIISYLAGSFVPQFNSFLVDIAVRSFITGTLYILIILVTRVSDDINLLLSRLFKQIIN